jgi:hypothetical protein
MALRKSGPLPSVLTLVAVFFGTLVVLGWFMDRELMFFDEGVSFTAAREEMHGAVIHRDYHTFYGPGLPMLLHWLWRLAPWEFLAGRAVGLLAYALWAVLLYAGLAGHARPWLRLAAIASFVLGIAAYQGNLVLPVLAGIAGVGGALLVLRGVASGRVWPFAAAGVLGGVATLLRYDAGAFIAAATMLGYLLCCWRGYGQPVTPAAWFGRSLAYAAGLLAVVAPAIAWFAAHASFADFNRDILDYSLHLYAANRQLPLPTPGHIRHLPADAGVYLPLMAAAAAAFCIIRAERGAVRSTATRLESALPRETLALLTLFGSLSFMLFFKGAVRMSWTHMLMAFTCAAFVLPVVIEQGLARSGRAGRVAAMGLLLVLLGPHAAAATQTALANRARPGHPLLGPFLVARLGGYPEAPPGCRVTPATRFQHFTAKEWRAVTLLGQLTAPDERVYFGTDRHDKAFANEVGLYFASGRRPGTRWYQLDPGLTTRADIQQEMIADLARNRVRWIVLDSTYTAYREPNASAVPSNVRLLDDWIAAHYHPVGRFEEFTFLLRRGEPRPPLPPVSRCGIERVGGA